MIIASYNWYRFQALILTCACASGTDCVTECFHWKGDRVGDLCSLDGKRAKNVLANSQRHFKLFPRKIAPPHKTYALPLLFVVGWYRGDQAKCFFTCLVFFCSLLLLSLFSFLVSRLCEFAGSHFFLMIFLYPISGMTIAEVGGRELEYSTG